MAATREGTSLLMKVTSKARKFGRAKVEGHKLAVVSEKDTASFDLQLKPSDLHKGMPKHLLVEMLRFYQLNCAHCFGRVSIWERKHRNYAKS